MKRILVINTFYYPYIGGGAEIICQEQAEGLSAKGYHVAVLTTTNNDGIIEDSIHGLTVYRVHLDNVYWPYHNKPNKIKRMEWHLHDIYNSKMKRVVIEVIGREQPDVVICHNIAGFSISVWDAIKEFQIPIIQVLHDQYLLCPNCNAFKRERACTTQCLSCRLMRLPHAKASRKVDVVVGVSQYVLSRLTSLTYFKGCYKKVIHNARSFKEITMKERWNGKRPLRIGFIGTLSKAKGIEWLIRSFMETDIDATLSIAGTSPSEEYDQYLHQLAQRDKRISFDGYVNASDHYQKIDLSIIPSLWPDTFPTVAFESSAYHVPAIASNMGGLPEIIQDGINGIIINPEKPDSLKTAIIRLYQNPMLLWELACHAHAAVNEMTNPQKMIDKYCEIIEVI